MEQEGQSICSDEMTGYFETSYLLNHNNHVKISDESKPYMIQFTTALALKVSFVLDKCVCVDQQLLKSTG